MRHFEGQVAQTYECEHHRRRGLHSLQGSLDLTKALSKNRSIDTLNLNKNKLTDACLPILLELAKVNKVLKKIYISQNNIKERSAREVIKKLKEMGVSLSV